MKDCKYCGEEIKRAAKKCKYCGEFLDKRLKPSRGSASRARAQKGDEMPNAAEWVLCFLCPGIGCIVAIVYLAQGYTKKGGIMLGVSLIMVTISAFLRMAAGR